MSAPFLSTSHFRIISDSPSRCKGLRAPQPAPLLLAPRYQAAFACAQKLTLVHRDRFRCRLCLDFASVPVNSPSPGPGPRPGRRVACAAVRVSRPRPPPRATSLPRPRWAPEVSEQSSGLGRLLAGGRGGHGAGRRGPGGRGPAALPGNRSSRASELL